MQAFGKTFSGRKNLTIGMDLGDHWSFYCVLDEAGKIILEQKVSTTPEAMKKSRRWEKYRGVSSAWRQEHIRRG